MTAARSSSRVAKVDAGKGVAKKDVAGRVVEPLAPVSASSSGIAMLAQAKLSVGRVDDPAELEADEMAQKFSQWNGAGGSVEVSEGSSGGDAMRSADTGTLETGGFEVGADVQSEISSRSGRGVPLADDQRSKFEQFFGKDLSAVRVHADNDASQLSGSLGAEAFTVGNDVYFGSGRYQSGASDKLLAHELTHVVQQNSTINRGIMSWMKNKLGMGKKKAPTPTHENWNPSDHTPAPPQFMGNNETSGNAIMSQGGQNFDIPYEGSNYDNFSSGNMNQAPNQASSTDAAGYEIPVPVKENIYDEILPPTAAGMAKMGSRPAGRGIASEPIYGNLQDENNYEIPHPMMSQDDIYSQPTPKGARQPATPPPVPPKMKSSGPNMNPWAFKGQLRAGGTELPFFTSSETDPVAPATSKKPNQGQRDRFNKQAILENNNRGAAPSKSGAPTAEQRQALAIRAMEESGSSNTEDEPIYQNLPKRRGRRS